MGIGLYKVKVSNEFEDHDWDTFLEKNPTGQYEQTSLWAQVKALHNWQPVRVVASDREAIVAGAQALVRKVPFVGSIGYVSKGPVFASDDDVLIQIVIDRLCRIAKEYHIQYFIVHPPENNQTLIKFLINKGFKKELIIDVVGATVMIDLSLDLDEILANMKKKTRQYIRRGERKQIKVRLGYKEDIGTFYQLMLETCRRQGVFPNPSDENYVNELWRVFNRYGYITLLLAEYNSEVLSAILAISFRETVRAWKIGWSGRYGDYRPNYVLWWELIKWAKSQGYKYLDFVGIDQNIARAILSNKQLSNIGNRDMTSFKLGFGGNPVILSDALVYVNNLILSWIYDLILSRIGKLPFARRILRKIS